ncbi:hypothetical protein P8605_01290 [Streptomyces sp. T-3]|nr:hypothetical protein [Streptomyces sp. T-3]
MTATPLGAHGTYTRYPLRSSVTPEGDRHVLAGQGLFRALQVAICGQPGGRPPLGAVVVTRAGDRVLRSSVTPKDDRHVQALTVVRVEEL